MNYMYSYVNIIITDISFTDISQLLVPIYAWYAVTWRGNSKYNLKNAS